ncbi:MAG: hypothetical protein IID34_18265 [Planctomycetes bacterium]|nr:hypothetical protein [Planctomycetota bacterium]
MFATEDNATESPVAPVPPRYRWLKRFLKLGGLLLLGLLLLRWWWGWEAHRRLQAEIDRIVARGEPIFPEDFDPPEEIPDDQNAALALIKAAELLTTTAEQDKIISDCYGQLATITPDEWALIADLEAKNAEAMSLVRRARAMPGVDWHIRMRSPLIKHLSVILPNLIPQRQLSKALCAVAAHNHVMENDEAAIEVIRDALHQAVTLGRPSAVMSVLGAMGTQALVVSRIEDCSHDLRVGHSPGASPQQVRGLIAELLDEQPLRDGLRGAMLGERAYLLDTMQYMLGLLMFFKPLSPDDLGKIPLLDKIAAFPTTPLYETDGVQMMKEMSLVLEACAESNWPDAHKILKPLDEHWENLQRGTGRLMRPLGHVSMPNSSSATVRQHFQILARRRMAAMALAIRLYEIDRGRRPAELAELVPDYLDEIPPDPMSIGGSPFTYVPDAAEPVLYSVGKNGNDDGGVLWNEEHKTYFAHEHDIVFFLDGRPFVRLSIPGAAEVQDE